MRGAIDHPQPGATIEADSIAISGWVDFDDGPTARVEAWLGETPLGRARLGLPRPDVATIREGRDAAVAGFELAAGLDGRPSGERLLRVIAGSVGGERHEFEPIPIVLAPPAPVEPSPRPAPAQVGSGGPRVLAFSNVLTLGGAAIYLFDLVRETRRLGLLEPTVATSIDGPLRGELEQGGIPVHLLGPIPLDSLDAYLDRVEELTAWAAGRGFEAILVNTATGLTLPGADVAARLGIPAIWSIHESFHRSLLWQGLGPGLREHAEAALSNAAAGVFMAESTRALYRDSLDESRSLCIPYGLDLEPIEAERQGFDRDRARREAGVPIDAELAICVGTVEPRKGQVQLLQAFELVAERHPRAELAFVGSDDAWGSATLAARIEASPLRDRMRMIRRSRDVHRWYGMADLLVCASDIESLPMTVTEAMAWGTPVLATSVFGLPELIEHEVDGWLCEPGDVGALAGGLDLALGAGDAVRQRIGVAARNKVLERHDLPEYARRFAELVDQTASP